MHLALAAALLTPAALLGVSGWNAWRQAGRAAEAEAIRAAEAAGEYARRVLDGLLLRADIANDLLRGATDEEIHAREQHFHALLKDIPNRTGEGATFHLFVHDRDARSLVSGTLYPVPSADRVFLHRDFNTELRGPGSPPVHVSRVHFGEVVQRPFFAVSRRREGSGKPGAGGEYDGIIAASVDVEAIGRALRRLVMRPGDAVSLLRSDGQVLVRTSDAGLLPAQRLPPDSGLVARMQRGEELAVFVGPSNVDGTRRVGVIRRVEGWPVYASVARDEAAVARGWLREMVPQAVLALASTLLLGLLMMALLRRERALMQANGSLERRVAERTAELAASAAEFRATFEESSVGKSQVDPTTALFLRVNPAYCRLTGYTEAELVGRLTPAEITHPDDRAADAERFRGTVEHGTGYRAEKRYVRKDGTVIWVEVSAALIRDPVTGAPHRTIATVLDITERRRFEDRLLLLAREVDHRAKNALAVVQAAVRLAPKHDAAAFARAVEGRVAALARAQVMLTEAGWRGADLRAVAEGAVAAFLPPAEGEAPGAEVELSGPPVVLSATAAQPVSLALHELATNAAKYGALSAPGGRVHLLWSLADGGAELTLRWEETGGPPAARPARRGFGSRVLEATMSDQLGGRVERQWAGTGLVCEITLPARSVVASAE